MKKIYLTLVVLLATINMFAQGWPANYSGVMLQGFYWDSFSESKWTKLEAQARNWDSTSTSYGFHRVPTAEVNQWVTTTSTGFPTTKVLSEVKANSALSSRPSRITASNIADVVINHRKNVSTWFDFPVEIYKGVTYEMKSTDICANDDGGKTKKEADKQGVKLSSNNDTGTDWDGMRDLDHSSQNVQTIVKAYLDMLLNDFGYAGFRYDMVKGYSGKFTGIYNTATKPSYSVGEYWDGDVSKVKNWLESTKVNEEITSAAFDFPIRYVVRDAINGKWSDVKTDGLANDNSYKQYAITFVENHDTEYRSAGEQQDLSARIPWLPMHTSWHLAVPHAYSTSTGLTASRISRR